VYVGGVVRFGKKKNEWFFKFEFEVKIRGWIKMITRNWDMNRHKDIIVEFKIGIMLFELEKKQYWSRQKSEKTYFGAKKMNIIVIYAFRWSSSGIKDGISLKRNGLFSRNCLPPLSSPNMDFFNFFLFIYLFFFVSLFDLFFFIFY